jgi:hypothetical protein
MYGDDEDEREGEGEDLMDEEDEEDEEDKKFYLPKMDDPKLFVVRCLKGFEKESVF